MVTNDKLPSFWYGDCSYLYARHIFRAHFQSSYIPRTRLKPQSENISTTQSCYCTAFYAFSHLKHSWTETRLSKNILLWLALAALSLTLYGSHLTTHISPEIHHARVWKWDWRKSSPKGPATTNPALGTSRGISCPKDSLSPYLAKTERIRCICPNAVLCNWKATSLGGLP